MLACSFQRAMRRSVAAVVSGLTATTTSLFIERSCLTRRIYKRLIEVVVWPFLTRSGGSD
jgi:hypothetical protein